VQFVYKQDDGSVRAGFVNDRLQALFVLTAKAGARDQIRMAERQDADIS